MLAAATLAAALPPAGRPLASAIHGAAFDHGLAPAKLAAVLEEESGFGKYLRPPGPGGTGDHAPRWLTAHELRGPYAWARHRGLVTGKTRTTDRGTVLHQVRPPRLGGAKVAGWGYGVAQLDAANPRHRALIESTSKDGVPLWQIPAVNIDAGARELAADLRRFGGDYPPAIAAYNAGPGRVARAIRDGKSADSVTEHGDYAQKVLSKAAAIEASAAKIMDASRDESAGELADRLAAEAGMDKAAKEHPAFPGGTFSVAGARRDFKAKQAYLLEACQKALQEVADMRAKVEATPSVDDSFLGNLALDLAEAVPVAGKMASEDAAKSLPKSVKENLLHDLGKSRERLQQYQAALRKGNFTSDWVTSKTIFTRILLRIATEYKNVTVGDAALLKLHPQGFWDAYLASAQHFLFAPIGKAAGAILKGAGTVVVDAAGGAAKGLGLGSTAKKIEVAGVVAAIVFAGWFVYRRLAPHPVREIKRLAEVA